MKKFLLFSGLLLLLTDVLNSQTVTINNLYGTSGNIVTGTSNYAASEAIYYESEIGASNFTTAATAIKKIAFAVATVGAPTTFSTFKVYMKNIPLATTTLATGTYSTSGYILVYDGAVTFNATDFQTITLATPFVRATGTNLEVLIERLDNVTHPGFVFNAANDASAPLNSRRYNGTTPSTTLTASAFRASIRFISPVPIDAALTSISTPTISCNSTSSFSVVLQNNGTSTIAAGAASVTFRIGNPNAYTFTKTNTTALAANATETIVFSNVNTGNAGTSADSAFVVLAGEQDRSNDTTKGSFITTSTIRVSNNNPAFEGVETTLPVFSYAAVVTGSRQLWNILTAPPKYKNVDLPDSLGAHTGNSFFYFDSYSGASSAGTVGRLFSNCITLPVTSSGCTSTMTFWTSTDNTFSTDLDSIYVSISTDKGVTWTRLAGYGRYSSTAAIPTWVQRTLSFTDYQGQTFQIAFEGVSKYGNIIGVDDINISSTCVLPVALTSFKGERNNNLNTLTWVTATESNNNGFELQRSADGINFSKVAFVASKAPNGYSSAALQYSYDDIKPLMGTGYYRLKQVDKDGKATLSNIVLLKGDLPRVLTISSLYPNPVRNNLNLIVYAAHPDVITITTIDLSGKVLTTQNKTVIAGNNPLQLNTAVLATGNYLLKIIDSKGETVTQRFTKQ